MRRLVVFRHGILLNRWFLHAMERFFRRRGYEVVNPSYPSTRKRIEEHAEDLARELRELHRRLEEDNAPFTLDCVTHSLGGLVLRYALTHCEVPPLHAAVLLVPPNRGAAAARYFARFAPYRWLYGRHAGQQLASEPPGIFDACGVPRGFPVGIIAGDARPQWNPAPLDKPNDRIVAVSEAMLSPLPLKVLPYGHTPILFRRRAWEETAHFLEEGRFRDD